MKTKWYLRKSILFIPLIATLTLTSCSRVSEENIAFPPSRIDLYVIDVSKSIVNDQFNSSSSLFDRVQSKIKSDISSNAIGSPEFSFESKQIVAKPALGLYVQLMGNRASDNNPTQIRSQTGSEKLWDSVKAMELNEGNTADLWLKIQELSSQILSSNTLANCEKIIQEGLIGQSGNAMQKSNISNLICNETLGSIDRINKFDSELSNFLSTPFERTGSPGTPGSDIFGTIKTVHGWIETMTETQITQPQFNFIFLSDMVHDADENTSLNRLIPSLDLTGINELAKNDSSRLNINFNNLNTNVYVVGLGAFGSNYKTDAEFSSKLQEYWKTYFEELGVSVNFTPTLDDVRLD
jgi:hypothetical protein